MALYIVIVTIKFIATTLNDILRLHEDLVQMYEISDKLAKISYSLTNLFRLLLRVNDMYSNDHMYN